MRAKSTFPDFALGRRATLLVYGISDVVDYCASPRDLVLQSHIDLPHFEAIWHLASTSEARPPLLTLCSSFYSMFTYIHQTAEPFDQAPGGNPFTKKLGSGGCLLL